MAGSDGVPGISGRVYRALLSAYPREFRDVYGDEMARVFRDLSREEWRRNGVAGLAGLWIRTDPDLAATAFVERRRAMRRRFLVPLALILGLLIALVDTSPGWDDTGVSAAIVLLSCGTLGALRPARAWQWALAVGVWIPALNIAFGQNYVSTVALAFALAGAYAGKLVSRSTSVA